MEEVSENNNKNNDVPEKTAVIDINDKTAIPQTQSDNTQSSNDSDKKEDYNEESAEENKEEDKELEEMFKSGVHYGYSRSKRHPTMAQIIYGVKNNTEIFDLEKTQQFYKNALKFMKESGKEKKTILFVGTKPGINSTIEKYAKELNMPYVAERWLGGTLTNFKVINNRVRYFEKLSKEKEAGEWGKYVKKERVKINKDFGQLERKMKSLLLLSELPKLLLVVDSKEENTAIREAKVMNIPIVAIMNSDCDLKDADYPMPSNDASMKSVDYLLGKLVEAYKKGVEENK